MFLATNHLYIYVESSLHAGAGAGVGAIDLPIQRERATGYPIVQAPGIKGALRSEVIDAATKTAEISAVFGPDTAGGNLHAGALSPGDARLLLLPVRSLKGIFAWTTSMHVLRRWERELIAAGVAQAQLPPLPAAAPPVPANANSPLNCYVAGNGLLLPGNKIVLEEFTYQKDGTTAIDDLAQWLAANAFPAGNAYDWWRKELPEKLVILPDDDFRDFSQQATEIMTRVKLVPDTKTVQPGALWNEEHLPAETLLYAPVRATKFRAEQAALPQAWQGVNPAAAQAQQVLNWAKDAAHIPHRLQLGGDETTGRGMVGLRWLDPTAVTWPIP